MSQTGLIANLEAAVGGLATVLTGVIAAFIVLMLLDVYESEVGLSIEPDH